MSEYRTRSRKTRSLTDPNYAPASEARKRAIQAAHRFSRTIAGTDKAAYVRLFWQAFHMALRENTCQGDPVLGVRDSGSALTSPPPMKGDLSDLPDERVSEQADVISHTTFVRHEVRRIRSGLHGMEIVGGSPTSPAALPDCVAIVRRGTTGIELAGTGTVIAPQVVVTAAHVIQTNGANLTVFVGNDMHVPNSGVLIDGVGRIHPDYVWNPFASDLHDIGIIILNGPSGVVQRPVASRAAALATTGYMIAGFGASNQAGTAGMGVQRYAYVSRVSATATEITAGPSNAPGYTGDSCAGDSGGPLYVWDGADYSLGAVVSRTIAGSVVRCGHGSIYTIVDAHRDFVGEFI
jgi:hypothetical protein